MVGPVSKTLSTTSGEDMLGLLSNTLSAEQRTVKTWWDFV